ncbi:MAG: type III pantothenate kinase [Candidatus Krumholzibacteria bacterium]|nr:type III pantothenate kinase [Candidatus Krumholzibacteria bacterium]
MKTSVLVMDRGNGSLKAALFQNGNIVSRWRDDPEDKILESVMSRGCDPKDIIVAYSSVVSEWVVGMEKSVEEAGIRNLLRAGHDIDLPFRLLVDNPGSLGPDRICAACGASARGMDEAVIIDGGTAVTVDLLTAEGFHGGSIFPCFGLAAGALSGGTAALSPVEVVRNPGRPPGRSTVEAIERGVFHGVRGGVREILDVTRLYVARPVPVLLTGGAAGLLLDALDGDIIHAPDLVLEGLYHLSSLAYPSK